MSSYTFKNVIYKVCLQRIYINSINISLENLALNNLHGLIYHKPIPSKLDSISQIIQVRHS